MHESNGRRHRGRWLVLIASSVAVVVLARRLGRAPDELTQIRASGEGWGDRPEASDGEAIDGQVQRCAGSDLSSIDGH